MLRERLLSLEELSEAIAQWRVHRQPRSIPEGLKRNAVALLGQYRKAELLRSLQITHSLLDRWQKRYGEAAAAAEGMLVELPDDSVPAKRDDSAERLALTLRGHGGVEVQGELTLDQWQQALRLVS